MQINNLQYIDMAAVDSKRFKVFRRLFLSLTIIFNGFIISYSRFSKDTANRLNNWITNLFSGFINNITEKEAEVIPITENRHHLKLINISKCEINDVLI